MTLDEIFEKYPDNESYMFYRKAYGDSDSCRWNIPMLKSFKRKADSIPNQSSLKEADDWELYEPRN